MPNISSATTIKSVQLTEQTTAPATPSSGYLRLYASSGSVLRVVDDSGNDYQLSTGTAGPDVTSATFVTLSTSSVLSAERVLTGVSNRITVDVSTAGVVSIYTPQDLHTGASPQFAKVSVGTGSNSSASVTVRGQYFSELVDDGTATTNSTINWSSGNEHKLTLGASITLAFSNGVTGGRYVLLLVQDSTGSHTVNWPGTVKWGSAGVSTLSTTGSTVDLFTFLFDGTSYLGNASLGF